MTGAVPVLRLVIPGEPVGKARARVTRHGTYTPAATRKAEARVRELWALQHAGHVPTPGARYGLSVTFHRYARYRRDLDNLVKLLMDGLNGYAWVDDHQVETIHASTSWTVKDATRTELAVWELGSIPKLLLAPPPDPDYPPDGPYPPDDL